MQLFLISSNDFVLKKIVLLRWLCSAVFQRCDDVTTTSPDPCNGTCLHRSDYKVCLHLFFPLFDLFLNKKNTRGFVDNSLLNVEMEQAGRAVPRCVLRTCFDVCYDVVRKCPVHIGFVCPPLADTREYDTQVPRLVDLICHFSFSFLFWANLTRNSERTILI